MKRGRVWRVADGLRSRRVPLCTPFWAPPRVEKRVRAAGVPATVIRDFFLAPRSSGKRVVTGPPARFTHSESHDTSVCLG